MIDIVIDLLYEHIDSTSACPQIEITTNYHSTLNEITIALCDGVSVRSCSVKKISLCVPLTKMALKAFKSLCLLVNSEMMADIV